MSITEDSSLLIGVFYDHVHAERAFHELRQEGFGDGQLSVALLEADVPTEVPRVRPQPTGARAGTAIGVVMGAVLGGLLGLLALLWWQLTSPVWVLGLVLGITTAGTGLGGVCGALIGWLIRSEEPMPEVIRPHRSRGIVTVRAYSRYDEAAAILRRHAGCDADPASATETPR